MQNIYQLLIRFGIDTEMQKDGIVPVIDGREFSQPNGARRHGGVDVGEEGAVITSQAVTLGKPRQVERQSSFAWAAETSR